MVYQWLGLGPIKTRIVSVITGGASLYTIAASFWKGKSRATSPSSHQGLDSLQQKAGQRPKTSQGEIVAYVSSKSVPSFTETYLRSNLTGTGLSIGTTARFLVYERALDDGQRTMVDGARRLASCLGMDFRVIDMARANPVNILVHKLRHDYPRSPSVRFELRATGGIDLALLEDVIGPSPSKRLEIGKPTR